MRYIDLQEAFELEIAQLDSNLTKPTTSDIEYWLTAGLIKFIKTRYSGINFKQTGFEQDQKRIDDLRSLVTRKSYQFTTYPEEYTVTLPEDYMTTLGETAVIFSYDHCWPVGPSGQPRTKNTDVLEATVENIDRQRQNTLSEYRLHGRSARPLRFNTTDGANKCELPESIHSEIVDLAVNMFITEGKYRLQVKQPNNQQ